MESSSNVVEENRKLREENQLLKEENAKLCQILGGYDEKIDAFVKFAEEARSIRRLNLSLSKTEPKPSSDSYPFQAPREPPFTMSFPQTSISLLTRLLQNTSETPSMQSLSETTPKPSFSFQDHCEGDRNAAERITFREKRTPSRNFKMSEKEDRTRNAFQTPEWDSTAEPCEPGLDSNQFETFMKRKRMANVIYVFFYDLL